MKTNKLASMVLAGAMLFFAFGCGSHKKAISPTPGMAKVSLPLSGSEYKTNKEYFRAKSSGKSPDLVTAKKIALNNAKAEIAGLIQTTIKSVTDNYTNQRSITKAQDFVNKFENLSREVVSQQLSDINIVGEEVFKDKIGTVEYWVAIAISKETILNGITNKISQDQKLQIDYDKKKYEEIFNAEMEKMKNDK
jgi:hypothetical protein